MKKKYYAVKNGRKKGLYFNWDDCKSEVIGFNNAEYKSFEDPYEALNYLLDKNNNELNKSDFENSTLDNSIGDSIKNQYMDKKTQKTLNFDTIEAYVDGSYNSVEKTYGSGVVIIKNGEVIETVSKKGEIVDNITMRNVAGEIEGSMIAMEYCVKNNFRYLKLYYDYSGIEKWCTGEWKTNKIGTKNYKKYYDSIKDKLDVEFSKVKAHSGIEYNELADSLAKKSIF